MTWPERGGVTSEGRRKRRQHLLFAFPRRKMGPVLVVLVLMLGAAEVVAPCTPGGLCPVLTDDPGVVNAIRLAEEDFNSKSSDLFHSGVECDIGPKTADGERSGVGAHILSHPGAENHRLLTSSVSGNCPFHKDPRYAKTMTCKFQVLEQPWVGPMQVTESSCSRTAK
ncbi:cystatin-like [Mobula birostris]|uniref:cystatin-like n=1 Tax=Mobula birostris TaxID=1983395 RepID=UPI003B287DF8